MKTLKLLNQTGTLLSANLRKVHIKKGAQLIADLKIETKTEAKSAVFLPAMFFNRKGVPRLSCEDEIAFAGELEHHDFAIWLVPKDAIRYNDISVRRITASLLPQKQVTLRFVVSLKVAKKHIGDIADRLSMPLAFSLEPMKHLFDKGLKRSKAEVAKARKAKAKKKAPAKRKKK